MISKKRSTNIVNSITPGAGILVLGRGLISCRYVLKMHSSFFLLKQSSPLLQRIDHTNYVNTKDNQGMVIPNCTGSCARAWSNKSYIIMHYFL